MTANIALPGRALVCLPGARGAGVSRRITDEAERERLRRILEEFGPGAGWIARTAAEGRGVSEFLSDKSYLEELAGRIRARSEKASGPLLLHRELDVALRSLRDLVTLDCAAIRVDDAPTFERMREFLAAAAPDLVSRLELYEGAEPLFEKFGVEKEIEGALKNRVHLASGGSVVIHQTEALVAIDVNTGKFVGSDALEETVFATNLEAVAEIARQIRLRDLGGILVVDFIDMEDPEHRREVVERFEKELSRDRARTRLLQISEFGLVEITRQRSRGNLEKTLTHPCPCCAGERPREDGPLGRPGPAPPAPRHRRPLHSGRAGSPASALLPGQAPRGGRAGPPPGDRKPVEDPARAPRRRHPPPDGVRDQVNPLTSVFKFHGMNPWNVLLRRSARDTFLPGPDKLSGPPFLPSLRTPPGTCALRAHRVSSRRDPVITVAPASRR